MFESVFRVNFALGAAHHKDKMKMYKTLQQHLLLCVEAHR
jgi:hypothetical protein